MALLYSTPRKSRPGAHPSLTESCRSILERWAVNTDFSDVYTLHGEWYFWPDGAGWLIAETADIDRAVFVSETSAARIAYAVSVGADRDVIAESLNLR